MKLISAIKDRFENKVSATYKKVEASMKKKLITEQIIIIKEHFIDQESPTNKEIQTFIQKKFHMKIEKSTINSNRSDWGLPSNNRQALLSPEQISILKDHFKDHNSAKWKTIQTFIYKTFDIEYSKCAIDHKRKKWGLSSRNVKVSPKVNKNSAPK
jgi:transposase